MSSDFTDPPHFCVTDANEYTNQIHDIFNEHWVMLNNVRKESIGKIHQWRRDCKERIMNYANEQKILSMIIIIIYDLFSIKSV